MDDFNYVPYLIVIATAVGMVAILRAGRKLDTAGASASAAIARILHRIDVLSQAVGRLVGYPYDVACPTCGVAKGHPCTGGDYTNGHRARFEASPLALIERENAGVWRLVGDPEATLK